MTKTADGNQSFHKSLLSKQEAEAGFEPEPEPSIFNKTPNTIAEILQKFDQQSAIIRQNNMEKALSDSVWSEMDYQAEPQKPALNLANFDFEFNEESAGTLKLPDDCMPQSLAVYGSRIYVSDVFNNQIMLFEDFHFAGYWPASSGLVFNIPRHVACLPNGQVLILDETRLLLLDPNGQILDQFYNPELCGKFRGLTWIEIDGQLKIITTQKMDHKQPVFLIFFALKISKGIERKMNITSGYTDHETFLAKSVYCKAAMDRIYVSDFGNGVILDTDTKFYTTQ